MFKIAFISTHYIQYQIPFFRKLSEDPDFDIMVYFLSNTGLSKKIDRGFNIELSWDSDLTTGYKSKLVKNYSKFFKFKSKFSLFNPGIIYELYKFKPKLIVIHGHSHLSHLLVLLYAKIVGIPIAIRTETNIKTFKVKFIKIKKLLYNYVIDYFLYIGNLNKEFYELLDIADSKILFAPYTVDNEYFFRKYKELKSQKEKLRQKYQIPKQVVNILFLSKLMNRKRPIDLLKALKGMLSPSVHLTIVGSGELEFEIKKLIAENELNKYVTLIGFLNYSQLPEAYSIADIFVIPSEGEPWGLVVNEAMCFSLPIIVTDEVGSGYDLVEHGVNGYVYEAGNINQLKYKLKKLIYDPNLRLSMGQASLKKINNWSFEQMSECFKKLKSIELDK